MGTPRLSDIDPEERRRSYQLAVLAAEEDAAKQWVDIIRRLVVEDLDAEAFTERRLANLRAWRKAHGRRMACLKWTFDNRRRPSLVARDAQKVRADARRRIAEWRAEQERNRS